jgi:hypothetical protein
MDGKSQEEDDLDDSDYRIGSSGECILIKRLPAVFSEQQQVAGEVDDKESA